MNQTTLQYTASLSKAGHRRLGDALFDMGVLYNALLIQRKSSTGAHRGPFKLKLQNCSLTELRAEDPHWQSYSRRLMAETAKKANQAWNAAQKANGKSPLTKNPHWHRTLQVSEPANQLLKVNEAGTKATLRIKGLPALRFRADHRLPRNEQPRVIRVTQTPRRVLVSLVFNLPEGPAIPALEHSVGIDPGVKFMLTAAGSDGETLFVPGQDNRRHRKLTRKLRRRMQRQRDSALRDGRAQWVTQKTRKGKTKRRFRWIGKPSKEYLRCALHLPIVEQKRADSLKGIHHRVSTALVRKYRHVCTEDTKTAQMTRSAKGTPEEPGNRVRQKAGLNREILAQGWYMLRQKLVYKCRWLEREFIPVPAQGTSQTCAECQWTDPENRRSQAGFRCVRCGHQANADANAAENIRRSGVKPRAREDESPGTGTALGAPPAPRRGMKHDTPFPATQGRKCCAPELHVSPKAEF